MRHQIGSRSRLCSTSQARRLRRYTTPAVLLVDTTNKPFAEWNEVFPNSSSVTALVDRLLHHAEIVKIEGESYRAKEAKERAADRHGASFYGRERMAQRLGMRRTEY